MSSSGGSWDERAILAQAEELGNVGAYEWRIADDLVWWSDQACRILGMEPGHGPDSFEQFLPQVHPDDRDDLAAHVAAAVSNGTTLDVDYRIVRPDGTVRYLRGRGRLHPADDDRPERMVGSVTDVTDDVLLQQERDQAVKALAASEERHRLLAENAWDVVWTMGVDGSITYVSPSVERVRGFTPQEAAAQTLDQIHTPDSAAKVMEYYTALYAAMAAGEVPPVYHGEREYYRKDGSIMLGELQVIPQVDADGTVIQILGVTRDISERRRFEEELNRLAVTDPLTGVWNRRQGEKLITADMAEAQRYDPTLSVLMLDIDYFKTINDRFGHQVGDHVLIELTRVLAENLRGSDVLVRWGGEEFVILLQHCTVADAVVRAQELRELVADATFGEVGTVTVSIGAAQLRADDSLDTWLDRADRAMYAAKAAGRNTVKAET